MKSVEKSHTKTLTDARNNTISSLVAAVISSALFHPFDLIKTRKQVYGTASCVILPSSSTIFTMRQILAVEGVKGLFKGFQATALASGISFGLFRYIFDGMRQQLTLARTTVQAKSHRPETHVPTELKEISVAQNFEAGLVAALLATVLVHPLWLVKTRLELQAHETKAAGWPQYDGVLHCIRHISRQEGYRKLWAGLGPAIALIPHPAIQMFVYEELKKQSVRFAHSIENKYEKLHMILPFFWGYTSKVVAICATYPLQVARARQQVLFSCEASTYFWKVIKGIYSKEGLAALYKGLCTHLQKASLQSGLMFFLFEYISRRI